MTTMHIHKYKVVDATASEIYHLGLPDKIRTDTRIYIMCKKCDKVKIKTYTGREISPGDIVDIAKSNNWDYNPRLFA